MTMLPVITLLVATLVCVMMDLKEMEPTALVSSVTESLTIFKP